MNHILSQVDFYITSLSSKSNHIKHNKSVKEKTNDKDQSYSKKLQQGEVYC